MRKLVGLVLPLASLSIATVVACSSSSNKPHLIDAPGSNGSGSGSGSGDGDAPICPAGPKFQPMAAINIGSSAGGSGAPMGMVYETETQRAMALGSNAAQAGFDAQASSTQPYQFTAYAATGSGATEQELQAQEFEDATLGSGTTPEAAHNATLPAPGTYMIGSDDQANPFVGSNAPGEFRMQVIGIDDFDGSGFAQDFYLGYAGTFKVDATPSTTKFQGSITTVSMIHIDLTSSMVASDQCESSAEGLTWNGTPRKSTAPGFTGRNEAGSRRANVTPAQMKQIYANVEAWKRATHPEMFH